MTSDICTPTLMTVADAVDEAPGVRTLRLEFQSPPPAFGFRPGQFGMFSAFGAGECPLCIASPPARADHVECTFRTVGRVTAALAEAEPGDTVGFRGPYGNGFPVEQWRDRNVVIVAGGIGLPPVRSLAWSILDARDSYGSLTIIYGARSVNELIYKRELEGWQRLPRVKVITTVDPGGETPDWRGKVGFVPFVLQTTAPAAGNAVAAVCGPPIMIKFSLLALDGLGFAPQDVYTTLESRMKCGLGKCGRCNVGKFYICKDGPVFTAAQLRQMPSEY